MHVRRVTRMLRRCYEEVMGKLLPWNLAFSTGTGDIVFTNPSTNRAERRVASFMRRTMLPLRQTAAPRRTKSCTYRVKWRRLDEPVFDVRVRRGGSGVGDVELHVEAASGDVGERGVDGGGRIDGRVRRVGAARRVAGLRTRSTDATSSKHAAILTQKSQLVHHALRHRCC